MGVIVWDYFFVVGFVNKKSTSATFLFKILVVKHLPMEESAVHNRPSNICNTGIFLFLKKEACPFLWRYSSYSDDTAKYQLTAGHPQA